MKNDILELIEYIDKIFADLLHRRKRVATTNSDYLYV